MADLRTILTLPEKRQQVIADAERLLNDEVSAKGGLTGIAIKGGFKLVQGARPGMVRDIIDGLLDDFAKRLDPLWQDFATKGGGKTFPDYLSGRRVEMADALLGITDDRARVTRHTSLKKAYDGLRPKAKEHVEAAAPGIGRLIEKYARG